MAKAEQGASSAEAKDEGAQAPQVETSKGAPTTASATVIKAEPTNTIQAPVVADPKLAGRYRVKHGSYKIGGTYVGTGSILELSAHDADLGLKAGVLEAAKEK